MYRRPLLITLLTLFFTGCYAGPGYYESDVYTQPTTVVSGGAYAYDNGYNATYYQERRVYVAPQPRYYTQPRYYAPAPRYYAPPPVPRYYQPGRPPGYGWRNDGFRGNGGFGRNDGFRGDRGNRGWDDHGGRGGRDGRDHGRGGRGDGRGGHR
ncbi:MULTISPECIES: lipoprotein [Pseudomonas syringae group]|uniref:Lipoprotein, putative n=1 Tax=Pseudomonas syringae pv. tomato (strain ATCC BAA-871 / DC3000) TaxID=223283 RepID=Q87XE1_PSESM|nr:MULTISPECIES: lipoprotein [Pseudomonas syringae group]AAO57693.1 lipoprotein, putative [Pseudomonas syringae pv. tomato str. DC3000]MBM0207925.1 lipoprotein [Pseudomonas syringae pv. maculicola]MBW8023257.1 lipoprotein [Pseudomonas syringae pv. tomato]QQN28619.1 lipoprotein [Pseudomonas syringae pv. maculicola]